MFQFSRVRQLNIFQNFYPVIPNTLFPMNILEFFLFLEKAGGEGAFIDCFTFSVRQLNIFEFFSLEFEMRLVTSPFFLFCFRILDIILCSNSSSW